MTLAVNSDGRTARRSRNRDLVLDAVLELFGEGRFRPTPDEVAERSGVSLRSVYRYVQSRDDLLQSAMERQLEKTAQMWSFDYSPNDRLDQRIDALVEHRLRLHEAIATTNRASRAFALRDSIVAERLAKGRRALRRHVERQFEVELSALPARQRRAVLESVDTLLQLEGLDALLTHKGLSVREARETLTDSLTILLTT